MIGEEWKDEPQRPCAQASGPVIDPPRFWFRRNYCYAPGFPVAYQRSICEQAVVTAWRWLCRPFRKLRQRFCSHVLCGDTGYTLGTGKVDRWCGKCGKMITIPVAEDDSF